MNHNENKQTPIESLKYIEARIAALTRGLQTNPENVLDYTEALEIIPFLLKNVISDLETIEAEAAKVEKKPTAAESEALPAANHQQNHS